MLIHGKTTKPNPQPVLDIERKSWLKLLGIIFQENPCCWDLHVDKLIAKASSRLYILRVCKFYGYSQDQLNKLFDSLILSLLAYGLEVWGSASKKYLDRIDNFCKRAYRYGYTADFETSTLIEERHKLLFNKITITKDHPLQDLLPPKRSRMLMLMLLEAQRHGRFPRRIQRTVFLKDPVTYGARKSILETMIRLPSKAALLKCFRYKKRQNN